MEIIMRDFTVPAVTVAMVAAVLAAFVKTLNF